MSNPCNTYKVKIITFRDLRAIPRVRHLHIPALQRKVLLAVD